MIPKKEFILMIIDSIPEKSTYTKIHKLVYLLNDKIRHEFNEDMGYEFNSFMSHTGPYDRALQDDLDTWITIGLLHNYTPPAIYDDLKVTKYGEHFLKDEGGIDRLRKSMDDRKFKQIEKLVSEYAKKSEQELIQEAVKEWSHHHTDRISTIKSFFPFVNNTDQCVS